MPHGTTCLGRTTEPNKPQHLPEEAASDFTKEYPKEDFPVKGLKEILGPDDQFYGYIIIWNNRLVSAGAKLVEDKAMRVYPHYVPYGGS
jgi:hypothetical protein